MSVADFFVGFLCQVWENRGIFLDFFREIPNKNNVTCGAIMSGFIQNGYIKDAINLFVQMQAANFEPGVENLSSILDFFKLQVWA